MVEPGSYDQLKYYYSIRTIIAVKYVVIISFYTFFDYTFDYTAGRCGHKPPFHAVFRIPSPVRLPYRVPITRRHPTGVVLVTIDMLCRILGCKVEDIMEYVDGEG